MHVCACIENSIFSTASIYNSHERLQYYLILMYVDLPTLYELIDFSLCDGTRLNGAKEIGRDYHRFGVLLLKDATGAGIRNRHTGGDLEISTMRYCRSGYEEEGDL